MITGDSLLTALNVSYNSGMINKNWKLTLLDFVDNEIKVSEFGKQNLESQESSIFLENAMENT